MHEHIGVGKFETVLDFVCGIAEIERNCHASRLENAKIYRQPFKAVHEKNRNLVALLETATEKEIREPVRLPVELLPSNLAPERLKRVRLDKRILSPCGIPLFELLRIYLHKCDIIRPFARIALQYLRYHFHGRKL